MDFNRDIEIAITLGTRKGERAQYNVNFLYLKVLEIFKRIGYKYLLFSIEPYDDNKGGHHVHVYYVGQEIFWKDFNKEWGIGYVRDKAVYNRQGWIGYLKKQDVWYERGEEVYKTVIEKLTGTTISEAVFDYENRVTNRPYQEYESDELDDLEGLFREYENDDSPYFPF